MAASAGFLGAINGEGAEDDIFFRDNRRRRRWDDGNRGADTPDIFVMSGCASLCDLNGLGGDGGNCSASAIESVGDARRFSGRYWRLARPSGGETTHFAGVLFIYGGDVLVVSV